MTSSEFQQWRYDLKAHGAAIAALTRLQAAALPQFYSTDDLAKRYCLGRDGVLAALKKYLGYQGSRGKPVRVPLDQVLLVDQALRAEVGA